MTLFRAHIPNSFAWLNIAEFKHACVCGSTIGHNPISCGPPAPKQGSCCGSLKFFNSCSSAYILQADSNIIYCTGTQIYFTICFIS